MTSRFTVKTKWIFPVLFLVSLVPFVASFDGGGAGRAEGLASGRSSAIAGTAPPPQPGPSSGITTLKWLIVGGGPHGVHIAARLLEEGGVSRRDLRIVDDEEALLLKWKRRTAATGMTHLRSSASYHLDVRENALKQYARGETAGDDERNLFAPDYKRPLLEFFNRHCDRVVDKFVLDGAHVRGMVTDVEPFEDHVRVEITERSGDVVECRAENVVLALGSDAPAYPDWVNRRAVECGKVRHIFDEEEATTPPVMDSVENDDADRSGGSIAVVGGGISGAHLALKLSREGKAAAVAVHMISRHELREQQFDTHQDWMMSSEAAERSQAGGGRGTPECQLHFESLTSFAERRDVIKRERRSGTVSASVSRGRGGLRYAIKDGSIRWHTAEVVSMTEEEGEGKDEEGGGGIALALSTGDEIRVDRVILATGFGKRPPGKALVDGIARRAGLDLCSCGYPAPDRYLRWHRRIFVAGALAELELGPSARNIAGARLASERIVAAARGAGAKEGSHTCASACHAQ